MVCRGILSWELGEAIMGDLSDILTRGERSRLFPVLADTSKEGRTLSIFLACLENVEEFGGAMLASLGQKVGARARIETYTEIVLKKGGDKKYRPDGLIILRAGSRRWMALVEAKVGNSDLTSDQVDAYLDLAKQNGIDTVLTLSNQFAPLPTHHPVQLPAASRRKAELFHWSWMFVLTQASLLLSNDQVSDRDQRIILNEMVRFISHPSAGVKGFDQMPPQWSDVVSKVQAGARVSANSEETKDVVGAWFQEVRDLNFILSRQLATEVTTRISRSHAGDPVARLKASAIELAQDHRLTATFLVPAAASPIEICADLQKRSLAISMRLRAPDERKSTKARLSWLLRQLNQAAGNNLHVRLYWPGRTAHTQYPLAALRENPEIAAADRSSQQVLSFEVLLVKDLGAKFGQRKNFIVELEAAVPEFYEQVGQHLKAWQAPAPRLREDKADPNSVATEAIQENAEEAAHDGKTIEISPPSIL
jgi:hypothetical protein